MIFKGSNISSIKMIKKLYIFLFLSSLFSSFCYSRKVLREVASGGRDAERLKLKLEIKVEVKHYSTHIF